MAWSWNPDQRCQRKKSRTGTRVEKLGSGGLCTLHWSGTYYRHNPELQRVYCVQHRGRSLLSAIVSEGQCFQAIKIWEEEVAVASFPAHTTYLFALGSRGKLYHPSRKGSAPPMVLR